MTAICLFHANAVVNVPALNPCWKRLARLSTAKDCLYGHTRGEQGLLCHWIECRGILALRSVVALVWATSLPFFNFDARMLFVGRHRKTWVTTWEPRENRREQRCRQDALRSWREETVRKKLISKTNDTISHCVWLTHCFIHLVHTLCLGINGYTILLLIKWHQCVPLNL